MAPRTGQLDEISQAIGRISGQVESLDRYTHEREHNIANLTQAVNGIGNLVSREVAAAKAEINSAVATAIEKVETRLQLIDERVSILERGRVGDERIRSVWLEILKSPIVAGVIGGIMSAIALAWAFLSGHPR